MILTTMLDDTTYMYRDAKYDEIDPYVKHLQGEISFSTNQRIC